MNNPESGPTASQPQELSQPNALRDNAPLANPNIPIGCSREWSTASQDSVLYCPDIRPPSVK